MLLQGAVSMHSSLCGEPPQRQTSKRPCMSVPGLACAAWTATCLRAGQQRD